MLLAAVIAGPAVAAPTPAPAPAPAPRSAEVDDLVAGLSQVAVRYDPTTNRSLVDVTVTAPGAVPPWTWSVAVRGAVVAKGSTSDASIGIAVSNKCWITSMSVTAQVVDSLGRSAGAAATLDNSKCPVPPQQGYGKDPILSAPTLSEASFLDRLRAAGSPALPEGKAIYRELIRGRVNPAFALGMFHAESHSGTRGYAVTTRNWGNILYYEWTTAHGAVKYAPGNGYGYAMFPTWLASVRALTELLGRYWDGGYRSISNASARWLGAAVGSERHLRYLTNITTAMRYLPDDAKPVMVDLKVPPKNGKKAVVTWKATDNRSVVSYQVMRRKLNRPWTKAVTLKINHATLRLGNGRWTIAVRAQDAAGNWSPWKLAKFTVTIPRS